MLTELACQVKIFPLETLPREDLMDDLSETATYNANLGPIDFEVDLGPLPVSGTLPRELNGALVRNGPNPLFPDPAEHWFTGDGMIHRFAFAGGEVRYRNRWVRTKRWQAEQAAGCNLPVGFDPTTPNAASFDDGVANTNVLLHGGRLLALEEADRPVELDAHSLATLGPVDFGDRLNGPFTAHPKLDPQTGELLFFGYGTPDALSAGMSFGSLDAAGNVTRFDRFDAPYASMVHD